MMTLDEIWMLELCNVGEIHHLLDPCCMRWIYIRPAMVYMPNSRCDVDTCMHVRMHVYIYICVCVCVCNCVYIVFVRVLYSCIFVSWGHPRGLSWFITRPHFQDLSLAVEALGPSWRLGVSLKRTHQMWAGKKIDHFFLLGALVTTNAGKYSHAHVPNSITFHSHPFF